MHIYFSLGVVFISQWRDLNVINKQKLWFLTLFSIILVLSIYYITMPSEVLKSLQGNDGNKKTTPVVNVTESEVLTALRIESDEEVIKQMNELQEILNSTEASAEEKNSAFESLKGLNLNKGKEDTLEKKILDKYKLKSFIKINGDQIKVVIDSKTHDKELANKIIRLVQEDFDKQMYITIKFQS